MGWPFLGKFAMWVVIVLAQVNGLDGGCMEGERRGLLEFKEFLKSNGADADHLLPTWVEKPDHRSECCDWERVTCDRSTGHVTELSLHNIKDVSYEDFRIWFINASLFLPFKELRSLNLSFNSFSGWTHNGGFERLSILRKLEILDLASNNFDDNTIFRSLGALTSIKTLILSDNALGGYFPAHELVTLRNLETLDIGYSSYHGCLPMQGFEKLSVLRKLETINLKWNGFDDSVLPSLSALRSLKMLNLCGNNFGGLFPAHDLANLRNLERLDISLTQLNGIQGCESLSRLKRLETLYLDDNNFNKSIKSTILCLSSLVSLKNLSLQRNNLRDPFPARELTVLKNLEMLDLSSNMLSSLTMQDSKLLSKLSQMRHLDLSGNRFNNDVLRILGALPSLKFLSLRDNGMEGPLSNQELSYNLSNLEVLLLRFNKLNGTLPMEGLASFRHLEILDLSENNFFGSIPPSIGALSSLKALSVARNKLNGSLPIQGLCELKKLEELDLSHNLFEGILPSCLSNLRSIKFFDLSLNQFTGNISSSLLGSLNSLEYIDLSHNRFEGIFSFDSFANHSNLEVVELISDNDKLVVETEYTDWIPMFQLKVLVLSNCNLNKLSGNVPKFLLHQNKLRVIDLSHNNLTGSLTDWLLVNNTGLEFLNLRNNSFVSQFRLPPYRYINTYWMDVSDNYLSGEIQANMGEMFPYIWHINLSRNVFEGAIPSSFSKMNELKVLDLSTNNLSGQVPNQLVRNCISLQSLILSNNRFHGQIFSAAFNLTQIWRLQLNDNQFTGPLTNVLSNLPELYFLDIGSNYMLGKIPSSMDNMTKLGTLIIRNNSFNGRFPCALVPFVFMDISHNSFSGSLPSCSSLGFVEHMHLQGNKFTGFIPRVLLNSSNLLTLDIRFNSLSGSIPNSIRALSNLRILLFRGNQLGGSIPTQLCQLHKISLMDLSNNFFTGSIPRCLGNITFGAIGANALAFVQNPISFSGRNTYYEYRGVLEKNFMIQDTDETYDEVDEVEFVTKNRTSYYQGSILNFMSGLDLSCNKLSGEIPFELGMLSGLHALNLSRNRLTGPIPKSFSNLTQMESLDLSYNSLSGNIPSELIALNFLEEFIVAHNNLSGKIPDGKAQFGTFEARSYEGNPFLCGPPLEKNCTPIVDSPTTASSDETEGKWYDIDPVVFHASFVGTYITFLFGFATLLYINPYWRQMWFYLIEEGMYASYYFVYDTLHKLLGLLYN